MDTKRTVLAVGLSFIVMVLWSQFFAPQPPPKDQTQEAAQTQPAQQGAQQPAASAPQGQTGTAPQAQPQATPAPATGTAAGAEPQAQIKPDRPAKQVVVRTNLAEYILSEQGGSLISAKLVGITEQKDPASGLKQLVTLPATQPNAIPLGTLNGSIPGLENGFFQLQGAATELTVKDQPGIIKFVWTSPQGVEIIRTFTFQPDSYLFSQDIRVTNNSTAPVDDNLTLAVRAGHDPKEGGDYAFRGFGAYVDNSLVEEEIDDIKEAKVRAGNVSWVAYENSYFLQAIIPDAKGSAKALLSGNPEANPIVTARYAGPPLALAPGTTKEIKTFGYFGPKRIEILKAAGHNLDSSIYMGWFDILARPFLYFMNFVYDIVGNFAVSIIILTIIVKICFWPLTQKSYKSMKAMQALQPQIAKLKEKFGSDKQKFNQEMMGLYKSHKVNPMGGCLPMVIQIPVFIALYRLLDYAIELRHAPFMLWIDDLSAPDRLFEFGFSIPFMDPPYGIPVLTLLMGASMFVQQKMTPTPGDPTQAKVMMLMPIIFTFIFINFPSGLVLYWLVNNVLSIGQQTLVNKKA